MSVSLQLVNNVKVGVVGLGRTGLGILERMNPRSVWELDGVVWDCDQDVITPEDSWFSRVCLGGDLLHGLGCSGQAELGESVFYSCEDLVREWISDKQLIMLALGAAGGFSGGFGPALAGLAKDMGIPVLCVAGMPFSFEGSVRTDSARRTIDALREVCLAVVCLEMDDALLWAGEESWAQAVIGLGHDWMEHSLSSLLELLFEEGLFVFDLNTLQHVFDLGFSKTLFVKGEAEGDNAVDEALAQIMEYADARLPDSEVIVDRMLVAVNGGPLLGVSDVNRINQTIAKRFRKPAKSFFGASIEERTMRVRIGVFLSIGLGGGPGEVAGALGNVAPDSLLPEFETGGGGSYSGRGGRSGKPVAEKDDAQGYFDVLIRESNRGVFEDTEPNLLNGEDLDVPTFLRRGLRIKT